MTQTAVWRALAALSLVVTCFVSASNAGFIEDSIYIVAPSDGPYDYSRIEYHPDGTATIAIDETWENGHGLDYAMAIHGQTDQDPPLRLIKEVTNGTSVPWIGYQIDVSVPHGFELGSPVPTSDTFTPISFTAQSLQWGLPSPLMPGDTVTFDFVVNVVTSGNFSFTLTQTPVLAPEPSVVLLSAIGLAFAAVWRRR